LQNLSSLYIDFYLPEKYISRIQKDQKVEFITDAYPKRIFTGKINAIEPEVDPDSRNIRIEGIIDNPQGELLPGMYVTVTVTSGEVEKKLTVPQTAITYNPYGNLVYVVTKKIKKNGKIEEEDFNEDSGDNDENKDQDEDNDNDSVDKNSDVDKDNDQDKDTSHKLYVEQKFVTLGELRGDQVVVLSGLKEGDEIVTSGQLKLKNHSQIVINNDVLPTNDANPDVKDEQKI